MINRVCKLCYLSSRTYTLVSSFENGEPNQEVRISGTFMYTCCAAFNRELVQVSVYVLKKPSAQSTTPANRFFFYRGQQSTLLQFEFAAGKYYGVDKAGAERVERWISRCVHGRIRTQRETRSATRLGQFFNSSWILFFTWVTNCASMPLLMPQSAAVLTLDNNLYFAIIFPRKIKHFLFTSKYTLWTHTYFILKEGASFCW